MTQQSLVWKEGMSDWISVAELLRLRGTDTARVKPALPADLTPATASRRLMQRLAVWVWLVAMPPQCGSWSCSCSWSPHPRPGPGSSALPRIFAGPWRSC
ncbi:hypothetical protein ACFQOZ_03365 [Comamonas endophytica]|uniref:hypothetical protein n=1 Tax=Comamonas endophytica TaxID=2949090 RepID=UPI003616EC39